MWKISEVSRHRLGKIFDLRVTHSLNMTPCTFTYQASKPNMLSILNKNPVAPSCEKIDFTKLQRHLVGILHIISDFPGHTWPTFGTSNSKKSDMKFPKNVVLLCFDLNLDAQKVFVDF